MTRWVSASCTLRLPSDPCKMVWVLSDSQVYVQVLDEVTDVTLTKYYPRKLVNGVKINGLVH
jgi:hypothetical protein